METGTLVKWEKEIGEEIEEGDIIAQVETDKATMDMETPEAGYLATIIVPEGTSDLPLGKVIDEWVWLFAVYIALPISAIAMID